MENQEKQKKFTIKNLSKKTKVIIAVVFAVLLIGGGIGIFFLKSMPSMEWMNGNANIQMQEDSDGLTAEGTTTIGTIAQEVDFDTSITLMYVEEVYVAAGDVVEEGTPLLKIAADCIETAKQYYEKQIVSAQDALTEAQVAYESGKQDAYYVKLEDETAAANAEVTYITALAELDEDLNSKYQAWQDAVTAIDTYNYNLANNVYYINAGIDEKTAAVASAQTEYENAKAAYEACGISYDTAKSDFDGKVAQLAAVTNGTDQSGMTVEAAAQNVVDSYTILSSVEPLYNAMLTKVQELNQANQNLTQANTNYQREVEQAQSAVEKQAQSVGTLQEAYETASLEYETKKIQLQENYELAILEGKYAEDTYNSTLLTLEDTMNTAEKKLNDLKEQQANLLALEDGVVTAKQAGTLAAVNYGVEDVIFSSEALVSYYDTSKLDVSLEISQENIAQIEVGEEVSISMSGKRGITGKVASVASSATTGGSKSDVTYTVIVSIENEDGSLSTGTAVTVVFDDEKEGDVTDENK